MNTKKLLIKIFYMINSTKDTDIRREMINDLAQDRFNSDNPILTHKGFTILQIGMMVRDE